MTGVQTCALPICRRRFPPSTAPLSGNGRTPSAKAENCRKSTTTLLPNPYETKTGRVSSLKENGVSVATSRGGPLTSHNLSLGSGSSFLSLERKNAVRNFSKSTARPFPRLASMRRKQRRERSEQYARMTGGWGVYAGAVSIEATTVPSLHPSVVPSHTRMILAYVRAYAYFE